MFRSVRFVLPVIRPAALLLAAVAARAAPEAVVSRGEPFTVDLAPSSPAGPSLVALPEGGFAASAGLLGVRLPASATGEVRVTSSLGDVLAWRADGMSLVVDGRRRTLGEPRAAQLLRRDASSSDLPGIYPSVTERYRLGDGRLDHEVVLDPRVVARGLPQDGVLEWAWRLDLPEGGAMEARGDGFVVVVAGRPAFELPPPFVVEPPSLELDAPDRERFGVGMRWDEGLGQVILSLPVAALLRDDAPTPFVIDPTVVDVNAGDQDVTLRGVNSGDYLGSSLAIGDLDGDSDPDFGAGASGGDGASNLRNAAGDAYVAFGPFPSTTDIDLTSADVIAYGQRTNDALGGDMRLADVNDDGDDDLIVSAVFNEGPSGSISDAGQVNVWFGPISSSTVLNLTSTAADVTIHGGSGDRCGGALAVGDVSGDGNADLALSCFWQEGSGIGSSTAGRVHVLMGPLSSGTIDLTSTSVARAQIIGKPGWSLGYRAIALADVGDSGDLDVILGAYTADGPSGTRTDAGAGVIVFGPISSGTTIDFASTAPDVLIHGADAGDTFGISVTAGQFDCDGDTDVAFGAHLADGPPQVTRSSAGEVAVFRGPFTSSTTIDTSTTPADAVVYSSDAGDFAAFSIGSGDLNDDGHGDLILGASLADGPSNGRSDGGEAKAIFGPVPDGIIDLASFTADVVVYGGSASDELGFSVLGADLSGDGQDDLLVGARGAGGTGRAYAAYVPASTGTREIHGVVYNDLDGDGTRDSGEPGVFPVTVRVYDSGSTLVATMTTNSNGEFSVGGLAYGSYSVVETDIAGWSSTTSNTVSVTAACTDVEFGDEYTGNVNNPSYQASLIAGGSSASVVIRLNQTVPACFSLENSNNIPSTVHYLAPGAAISNSSVVDFTTTTPTLSWQVFRPTTGTTSTGTSTGTTATENYVGFGASTYRTGTWDLPTSQVLEGQSASLGDGELEVCFDVKALATGTSKVEFFMRSSEDNPSSSTGRTLSSITDRRNIWSDDTTALWYPVHNSFDPYDSDIANGHAWQNGTWTRSATTNGFAKATYNVTVIP